MPLGKVYLIGAGPGDPGMVTLRGMNLLQQANVVLYDYLVNPTILAHCRPGTLKISLGQHGSGRVMSQDEINQRLAELVNEHGAVVRLKSGDPMVFARAGEELDFLASREIPFEIVPGVTAALAAAAYAGIPVTHRDSASAVAFVTGQEDAAKTDSSLDYAALASFPGTLVFYMGVTTVGHWSQALIAAGKSPDLPVAIVRRVSTPLQERIDTTLGSVAATVAQQRLRPPIVFIVGDVVAHGAAWSWFEKRPLFGQTVLVTRPLDQADDLGRPLAELGANVLVQPAIEIRSIADPSMVHRAIERLNEFGWLVFSSSNGVRHFFHKLFETGHDLRALGTLKIAAIGPGTAAELARFHLRPDVVPNEYRAESLAASLAGQAIGKRFLIVRANRGREVLAQDLAAAGGIVEQVVAYDSLDVEQPDPQIAGKLATGQIQWISVTSSAIARSLVHLFGESLRNAKIASISPITSATLRELGYEPAVEATEFTMPGVVAAIAKVGK
jgi:uroporphyrinogen III methyltransferase/synthase